MNCFLARLRPRALLLSLLTFGATLAPAFAATEYLDPEQAFRGQARSVDAQTIELRIDVAPGYHLYRERIDVQMDAAGADAQLGTVEIPRG
nr:protein-disulfide reductase DsbD N-terminal domain-containing protein [Piscinibacter sp.]